MAKLGTSKRPAVVRVQSVARAEEIVSFCNEHGWQVIVGIEPDEPEDIADVQKLMNRSGPLLRQTERVRPVSGNDYCPCGSGLKFKNCCMPKQSE